ncbi:uncharacterized protein LOC103357832 [Stegastes partitus]|uniref:Uncharacterized protein LOC103357832 n=1 Tax=Stegastes partitus TaxID=144197 RepID=A0A9Y4K0L3_9TELE|nr:PREDICTED: uncharacterized protein LOC103357832 [Stegastes partitus]
MQHRNYKLLLSTTNKYLQQKREKAYDLHRRKLEETRRIQRENNMLKEKISHIMATTGRVDNRNDYDKKSLSKERQQRELLRITKQNQMIQFRLSKCKPHYHARSWNEDWLKTLKLRDSIARYPRGGANQQKGHEKPSEMSTDGDKEQRISTDASTHSRPASSKANGKADSRQNEKRKETNKNEDAGGEVHKESAAQFDSKPNVPEKSISANTAENPGSSDTN